MATREDREYYAWLFQQSQFLHGQGCGTLIAVIVILFAAILTFSSCRSQRELTHEQTDSVRIEYRERIVKVPDTVYVEIPAQTAERTTQDSVSHLETDFAESDARINPDGSLTHTLANKPQKMAVETEKEIVERESVKEEKHKEAEKEKTIEYKDKPLTWWEQTQIYGLWALLFLLAVIYRRKIFSTAVRLFLKK